MIEETCADHPAGVIASEGGHVVAPSERGEPSLASFVVYRGEEALLESALLGRRRTGTPGRGEPARLVWGLG
jgi:hypothetical protein